MAVDISSDFIFYSFDFSMQKEEEAVEQELKQVTIEKKKPKWINPLRDKTRVIPFIVPNQEQRKIALGSLAGQKWRLKKSLLALYDDFDPIKKPQPGERLWDKEQDGQDFSLFSSMYRNHFEVVEETIYIAPFKCKLSKAALQHVKKKAKKFFYGAKVKFHHFDEKIDMKQFDEMISENGEKYYDAAKLNFHFTKHLPKKTFSIAIITSLLLYNGDNPKQLLQEKWVFGLGSIKDRTSWTSFEEIVKKGYGNKREYEGIQQDESEDNIIFLSKVINHETCHTFGMRHCIYFTCLMNGTSGYVEASKKKPYLCPVCIRKLQLAVGFDIAERYESLGDQKSLYLAVKIREIVK